jgi:hypothetical protein
VTKILLEIDDGDREATEFERLATFHPSSVLRSIISSLEKEQQLLANWQLCRLIAWAFWDQIPPTASGRGFQSKIAQGAGQLLLMRHVHGFLHRKGRYAQYSDISEAQFSMALKLFLAVASARKNFALGHNWPSTLHNGRTHKQNLILVHAIIDNMVNSFVRGQRATADSAMLRVQDPGTCVVRFSPSKIEKTWAQYRCSAPYVYVFFPLLFAPELKDRSPTPISDEEWIARVIDLCNLEQLIDRFGRAAFAADVLRSTGIADVRLNDFRTIARVKPASG